MRHSEGIYTSKTVLKGLSKSAGVTRTPYSRGIYKFEAKEAEETQSKAGNIMFVIKMEILEAPEQDGGRDVTGKPYTHRFVIMEEYPFMLDGFKDFLNACEVKVASDDGVDVKKTVGKTFYGEMRQSTDKRDGTLQAQVSKWYSEEAYAERTAGKDEED